MKHTSIMNQFIQQSINHESRHYIAEEEEFNSGANNAYK